MNKYRIAIIAPFPIQYQVPLFRELSKCEDIDLTVLFCSKHFVNPTKERLFGVTFKWDIPLLQGYRYKFLPTLLHQPASRNLLQLNPAILKELWQNKYDAVWIHGYMAINSWFAFIGAWLTKTQILFRGESHLLDKKSSKIQFFKRLILSQLFKKVDSFLAIGSLNMRYYEHYGVSEKKLFLAPYAVDNSFFQGHAKKYLPLKEELRQELGVKLEQTVILFAGKMIPRKRAIDLLKAYNLVKSSANLALIFVGDGACRGELEEYVEAQSLKNVYFEGFKNQSEITKYFAMADVFILPSCEEPWGLTINEAMNFKLPIISTDHVGASFDLVKNNENGFIYEKGNVEELASILKHCAKSKDKLRKMGKKSLEIINKWDFSENIKAVKAALEMYRKGEQSCLNKPLKI